MEPVANAPTSKRFRSFEAIGKTILSFCSEMGGVALLLGQTVRAMCTTRWDRREIVRQCYLIGNRSMGIVLLTGGFTGMVLSLQFAVGLAQFGLKLYTGQIVGLSIVRELGPVLSSLMVAARVGSGIAAELGSMVVTEQVQAIEAMGANPLQKLVVPRLVAMIITLPLLAVMAEALGILGGLIITVQEAGVSAEFYMNQIWGVVGFYDFVHGIAKTVVFGIGIVMVSCYQGLVTQGGTQGVGRATTRAVVYASIMIFVSDFFLTKLLIIL